MMCSCSQNVSFLIDNGSGEWVVGSGYELHRAWFSMVVVQNLVGSPVYRWDVRMGWDVGS
jgi:hypothetical protein